MIHAFKQIRLTNTLLSGSGSALVFGGTPLVFKNETGQFVTSAQTGQFVDSAHTGGFVSISQTGQFVDSSKTGQFITTAMTGLVPELFLVVTGQVLSGNWNITGISGANVYTSGTSIVVSTYNITSATGQFVDSSKTGNFVTNGQTGVLLARGETGLFYPASNPNNYITAAQAGGVSAITVTGASISGNVNFTGIGGLNVSLSGTYVLISGGSATNTGTLVSKGETGIFVTTFQTGQFVDSAHTGGFVSISQTGQFVDSSKTGQFVTTAMTGILGIWTGNQQSFATILPTGIDFTGIFFPSVFSATPRTILTTMEVTGDIMYMVNVRNRNVSGYTAIFSDIIQESGVVVHTFSSL